MRTLPLPSAGEMPRFEVVDEEMATILAAKTPLERLAIANGMFRSARRMLQSSLHAEHPEWEEDRLREEVSRRLSRGSG